jgi:hypothetical protein
MGCTTGVVIFNRDKAHLLAIFSGAKIQAIFESAKIFSGKYFSHT